MKNFFKKLAFALALAMVVLAIAPAANASAAAAPKLNTTGKKLYLEQDVATGNYKDYFTLKVWNKGDYKVTFKSMNPEIATIHSTNGTVKAKTVGEALLKATVTNTKTGKVVKNLECKVWVKRNAVEIGVSTASAAKLDNVLAIGDKVKLNIFRKATTGQIAWQQADKTIVTDYIVWSSSDTKVATVDKWGTVKAVGEGSATITAKSLQTEDKTVSTTKEVKLTVTVGQKGIVSAAQKDLDSINLIFGQPADAKEVNKDTVKVYSLVGSTKVSQAVKNVTIDEKNPKNVTVDLFVPFTKDTTYIVEFAGKSVEFVTVNPVAENVARIEILTNEAVKSESTEIKYALYTENGVDITEAIVGRVDITSDSHDCYIDNSRKTITFFEAGKVATVKAVFHTYTYNEAGVEKTIETTTAIKSVDKASVSITGINAWTISANNNTVDFSKDELNHKLSLSDNGYYLMVQLLKSDKKTEDSKDNSKFTFESSNNTVLIVNGKQLFPVRTGNATVLVKYDGTIVGTVDLTILPEREAATLTIESNKTMLSLGKDFDVATIKLAIKDQLSNDYTAKAAKIQLLSAPAGATAPYASATDVVNNKIELNGSQFSKAGVYQFKVTIGNLTRVFSLDIKEVGEVTSQRLEISSNKVDTTLTIFNKENANASKNVSIKLFNVDKFGYKESEITNLVYGLETAKTQISGETGTIFYYEVTSPEAVTVPGSNGTETAVNTSTNNFQPITTSGSSISKVKTGTYKVAAYKLTKNGNNDFVIAPVGVEFINVTDNQSSAVVTQKEVKSSASTINGALVAGDIEIKLDIDNNGELDKVNANCAVKEFLGAEASGNNVYVKTVSYDASVNYAGQTYTFNMIIDVNKNLILK